YERAYPSLTGNRFDAVFGRLKLVRGSPTLGPAPPLANWNFWDPEMSMSFLPREVQARHVAGRWHVKHPAAGWHYSASMATLPATCACLMVARAKDAQSGSAGLLLQTSGGGHGLVLRIDGEGVVFVTAWDPSVKPPLTLITRIKHPAVRSAGE